MLAFSCDTNTSLPTRQFACCAVLDPLSLPHREQEMWHFSCTLRYVPGGASPPCAVWWEEPFSLEVHIVLVLQELPLGWLADIVALAQLGLFWSCVQCMWDLFGCLTVGCFVLHLPLGSCPLQNKTLWHTWWVGSLVWVEESPMFFNSFAFESHSNPHTNVH